MCMYMKLYIYKKLKTGLEDEGINAWQNAYYPHIF
jgi:hypothetical protein